MQHNSLINLKELQSVRIKEYRWLKNMMLQLYSKLWDYICLLMKELNLKDGAKQTVIKTS